jgi:hypothetical protein
MKTLRDFKDKHRNEDVYVLGSGPSLTYIDPGFFARKVVVATNAVAERMGLYKIVKHLYTQSHYHNETLDLAWQYPKHWFFSPEGHAGLAGMPEQFEPNLVYYKHKPTIFDFDVERSWMPDGLIVGSTSTHASMHLACHLGASTVILCGVDCGLIDNQTNQDGYVSGNLAVDDPLPWLGRWEQHLRDVKAKLVTEYGVRIYSINPFVNMNLEGHTWTGPN